MPSGCNDNSRSHSILGSLFNVCDYLKNCTDVLSTWEHIIRCIVTCGILILYIKK